MLPRSMLLVFCVVLARPASAQPVERQFAIAPDLLFDVLVSRSVCEARIDSARRTCEARVLDPDKLLGDRLKATLTVSAAVQGSLLKADIRKPAAVKPIFDSIATTIENNRTLGNIGRATAVTPEDVARVVTWAKNVRGIQLALGSYEVSARPLAGSIPEQTTKPLAVVLTPVARIATRAVDAAAAYKSLDTAAIPPDDLRPVTTFVVSPLDLGEYAPPMSRFVNATRVVLLPTGSKDPAQAVQPLTVATHKTTLQNALGASIDVNGVAAAFSTADLQRGRDVVILYDGGTEKRVPITEVTLLNLMLLPDIRQK